MNISLKKVFSSMYFHRSFRALLIQPRNHSKAPMVMWMSMNLFAPLQMTWIFFMWKLRFNFSRVYPLYQVYFSFIFIRVLIFTYLYIIYLPYSFVRSYFLYGSGQETSQNLRSIFHLTGIIQLRFHHKVDNESMTSFDTETRTLRTSEFIAPCTFKHEAFENVPLLERYEVDGWF